jgi:hypothetical protein
VAIGETTLKVWVGMRLQSLKAAHADPLQNSRMPGIAGDRQRDLELPE